jgi:hypothetical protein
MLAPDPIYPLPDKMPQFGQKMQRSFALPGGKILALSRERSNFYLFGYARLGFSLTLPHALLTSPRGVGRVDFRSPTLVDFPCKVF